MGKFMKARYGGTCRRCGSPFDAGTLMYFVPGWGMYHRACANDYWYWRDNGMSDEAWRARVYESTGSGVLTWQEVLALPEQKPEQKPTRRTGRRGGVR